MTLTRTDIRAAAFDDAARLGRVHVEAWRAAYRGILADDYLDSMSDIRHAAYWARILDDTDRAVGTFIAESEQNGIVGFADCGPERGGPPGFGEVMALYLLPDWQHRGTGRRLVGACAVHLAGEGFSGLAIWTLQDNPARGFYEALGGTPAETRKTHIGGETMVEQCYRWPDIQVHLPALPNHR